MKIVWKKITGRASLTFILVIVIAAITVWTIHITTNREPIFVSDTPIVTDTPMATPTKLNLKGLRIRVDGKIDSPVPSQELWLEIENTEYKNGILVGLTGTLIADSPKECPSFNATTNGSNNVSVSWVCPGKFYQSQHFSTLTANFPGVGFIPVYATGFGRK